MKGGLYLIYTSLLTVSVISSCALFLIVVSEALNVDEAVGNNVDLSGLHNVSSKVSEVSKDVPPPSTGEVLDSETAGSREKSLGDQEMTFADALSLNSVTTDGLPDTGQPPLVISLTETAKLELKSPEELMFSNDSEKHNDTKTFSIVESTATLEETTVKNVEKESTEPRLVFKAKPMHETKLVEDAFQSTTPTPVGDVAESQTGEQKVVEHVNIPVKPETPHEDIPSFSEWAQKQLAEAEKKDTVLNHSSQPSHSNTNFSSKSTKRSKNYASPACGAKIVAVNPEAGSASSILSPNRDEYMLNTCNSRIWFVVELCEPLQAQKIEIANFELFSSIPKDIAVSFSDRFPTRDWASVGQFTAKELRDVQSFDLFPHLFGKFIKVEMLSHHGSEHYCPISLFKVYGTSEFEVLEKENSQHAAHIEDDEDDEITDVPYIPTVEAEPSKNLFGSARDAVMSIVKKAARALVKTEVPNKNITSAHNDTSTDNMYKRCCSPSHIIVCDNCSDTLYSEVYDLISCSSDRLTKSVRQVFLQETLKCTKICQTFGLDFKSTKIIEFSSERVAYIKAMFPMKYLAAFCNILAIIEKKVVLNTSFETELNVTTNGTVDESPQKPNSETSLEKEIQLKPDTNSSNEKINETLKAEEKSLSSEKVVNSTVTIDLKQDSDKIETKKSDDAIVAADDKVANDSPGDTKITPETEKVKEITIEPENKDNSKNEAKNGKSDSVVEKPKETVFIDEGTEQIIIDNDSLLSELDQMAVDPSPAGPTATPNQNPAQAIVQKESVFLRLSNRVKTLERNMSLSGQYLEELSRRYKKQVEEMQKTFEKTVLQMTEERRKSNEREQKYLDQMTTLQNQVTVMAAAMTTLMEERDSWFGNVTFFKFILYQAIVIAIVFYYFNKRRRVEPVVVPISKKAKKKQDKFRRKSVEGVSGHATPSAKKRRPSEEALCIARQSANDTFKDDDEGEWQEVGKKNRRRKTSILHRNHENASKINWGRQDSIGMLQENPIPLDEEEFFGPVPEPLEFNEVLAPPKADPPKTNGFFSNLKTKTLKTRRLSSPAFLRTLSRQSSRSTPSPVVRTLEPIVNGNVTMKAASESPNGSMWSESTEISNGQQESLPGGRKKKSLKTILRKVF